MPRRSRQAPNRGSQGPGGRDSGIRPSSIASFGKNSVRPRKRFGQHFLTDPNILRKIVHAAEIRDGEVVLEIGPGLGHLTRALLRAGARVVAVEIDRDLVARLRKEDQDTALTVLEGDFLRTAPEEWLASAGLKGSDYKVVANLPYYITSAVLRHLLEARHQPILLVILVQREVAQQLTAVPNSMSQLAVGVQFYGRPRIVAQVPAGAFYPRPQVDSALVRVELDHPSRFPETDHRRFFEIVRAGFGVRRKQLHNALARGLEMNADEVNTRLLRAGIDPRRRAESLSLEEWQRVYLQFSEAPH
jgi:16S rRNA (adenine1518-N6/adenine1519-N6)-dimethyltransferase